MNPISNRVVFILLVAAVTPTALAQTSRSISDIPSPTGINQEAGQRGHQYMPPGDPPDAPREIFRADEPYADGQEMSLASLLAIAEANNPTIRQAGLHIDAELGKAIQAGLYPNPVFRYSAEQIGVEGTAGEFHGGIISQEVVRGGKLKLSRAKFLERVAVAEANAVAQQFRVCNDVRILFYSALSWQHRADVRKELVKAAEDASVTAREAYNMGQANEAGIRRSNAMLQRSRLRLMETENMTLSVKRQLSALVGVNVDHAFLVGELETAPLTVDFGLTLEALWANSPELIAAQAKLRSDRVTVQREFAEPVSNITIEGGAGYHFETDETVAVAGLSFPVKVFDRNQGTIRQARADFQRQCAEIKRIEDALKRDLAMEFEHHETAASHVVEYQQVILPELREAYRLLLESYGETRTDWNEVLHAQTDYFDARIEYYEWLEKLRESEVLIDGMLLRGGLTAAEGTVPRGHIDAVPKPR